MTGRRVWAGCAIGGLMSLLIAGCGATSGAMAPTKRRSSAAPRHGAGRPTIAPAAVLADLGEEPTGTVNLQQALAAALLRNPELAAFSSDLRAAEARVLQARALPNPELMVDVEEVDRGGEGFNSAETAISLGQRFELGTKRRWRTRVAEIHRELAGWAYESQRRSVFAETAQRFTIVLAAQQRVRLARSAERIAAQTSHAVAERVKAGKEPPLQASKTEAALELARMDVQEALRALHVARQMLAASWGAERVAFKGASGSLDPIPEAIPPLDVLRARLTANPDLAGREFEIRRRQAVLSSEKASRVPDLHAAIGYQHFEEDGTDALAFGVVVPLPIFDRNQGNIGAARNELAKARQERAAAELALGVAVAEKHGELREAHQRVTTLCANVIPAMEQAFQAAREGYRQGKFGFLDMLDAQRGLFEAKGVLLDALSDYHAARIELQRITGARITDLMNGTQNDVQP